LFLELLSPQNPYFTADLRPKPRSFSVQPPLENQYSNADFDSKPVVWLINIYPTKRPNAAKYAAACHTTGIVVLRKKAAWPVALIGIVRPCFETKMLLIIEHESCHRLSA
jgi:hypothetical protein